MKNIRVSKSNYLACFNFLTTISSDHLSRTSRVVLQGPRKALRSFPRALCLRRLQLAKLLPFESVFPYVILVQAALKTATAERNVHPAKSLVQLKKP